MEDDDPLLSFAIHHIPYLPLCHLYFIPITDSLVCCSVLALQLLQLVPTLSQNVCINTADIKPRGRSVWTTCLLLTSRNTQHLQMTNPALPFTCSCFSSPSSACIQLQNMHCVHSPNRQNLLFGNLQTRATIIDTTAKNTQRKNQPNEQQ